MDPETTRIVLKLQLDDVHAILKALPNTSNDGAVNSERVAFAALRDELTRKWQEVHGRVFAHNMIRKDNAGRESFRKLLNEEQQAERDHDMACTLAGQPVPQRPVVSVDNGVHNNTAAQRQEPIDHRTLVSNNLRFDLSGTQIAPSRVEPLHNKKRPAEDDARPTPASSNFKRARVDDVDDEDRNSITPYTHNSTLKKRAARVDPATLREEDDGRTKRTKLDPQVDAAPVADATHVPSSETVKQGRAPTGAEPDLVVSRTCSSCFDMHPIRDTIQLQCKGTGDAEAHAYCRDCVIGLFEACITDSSQFPPRCCNQVLPVFACIPFLPPALFARYVAKREELETPNRTYCSNFLCAKWVRPCNIATGIAACVKCTQKTCVTCKKKQHAGLCLEDQDVKKLMEVAKAKRWKTCPKCKEMIELEAGCYHIKCRCQHQFCYLCLKRWRTCKCLTWDERNITPEPIPANNAAPNVVNPANVAPPIARLFAAPVPANNAPANVAHPAHLVPPVPPFGFAPAVYAPVPNAPVFQPQQHAPVQFQAFGQRPQQQPQPLATNHPQDHDQGADDHLFKRLYKSKGANTKCRYCNNQDRWVHSCIFRGCGVRACWRCTKRYHPNSTTT